MREKATIPSTMAMITPTSTVMGFLTLNFENMGFVSLSILHEKYTCQVYNTYSEVFMNIL